jgi:hypothetical protein
VTVFNTSATGVGSLAYSSFLGGENIDEGLGIAVDSSGVYVTGLTESTTFPLQVAWQKTLGGAQNAFVSKLSPITSTPSTLLYSTYLGGNQTDAGTSIAVDANQNAYVTGQTSSPNFPVASPTQATLGGGNDAFVSVINSSGSLFFSTFLGGSQNENTNSNGANLAALGSIAVDTSGNVYVTGNTLSSNFPATTGVSQASCSSCSGATPTPDAFVAKYAVPITGDFSVSASAPTAVNPGTSATSTVTLTSVNSYSSPVNLSCTVTGSGSPLPACSASSFATNPVTPTTAGATSALTITTTGPTAALVHPSKFLFATWLPIAGLSLVGVGFSSARTRKRKLFGFLMIGMMLAALFLMPACGGGSGSGGGGGGGGTGGTPAGAYTVTITGTGTDSATTTHATTVTLTVN